MPTLPIKITAVEQEEDFMIDKGRISRLKVSFTVGPHGPYVIYVDPSVTNATEIPKAVQAAAEGIQAIFTLTQ